MNHFVFTGPESSGKTTLAKRIAELKNGVYIQEYARDYLNSLGKLYSKPDLLEIAKGQFSLQETAKEKRGGFICMDTDLITIKIWSEFKYGSCDKWILDRILSNKNSLYILCKPDMKWEADPLRENPEQREELYQLYKNTLLDLKLNFIEIAGSKEERVRFLLDKIEF